MGKQGQKLQSDVIKLSSPARGTLNKEAFLRGCFFLSLFLNAFLFITRMPPSLSNTIRLWGFLVWRDVHVAAEDAQRKCAELGLIESELLPQS